MNRIYRVVWSASLGMYQVASEVASGHGGKSRSVDRRRSRNAVALAAVAVASLNAGAVFAAPVPVATMGGVTSLFAGIPDTSSPAWGFDGTNLNVSGTTFATITGGLGTISNAGTLTGIYALSFSAAANVARVENNGVIAVTGNSSGSYNSGTIGTWVNNGSVTTGTFAGIGNGGLISRLENTGTITGLFQGVNNVGSLTSAFNSGDISATAGYGIVNSGQLGALTNAGKISGMLGIGSFNNGAPNTQTGTLTNSGTITGTQVGIANRGVNTSVIENLAGGQILGTGTGSAGIDNGTNSVGVTTYHGTIGAINNAGTISGAFNGISNLDAIGTINNRAGGLITGASAAIANQSSTAAIGQINNAGTIAGNIYYYGTQPLSIAGASGAAFGTLTGFGGTAMGTLASPFADLHFNGGNLVLNDILDLGNTRTAFNDASVLQVNRSTWVAGNYSQGVDATLLVGVAGGAFTAGNPTTDAGYGRLMVAGTSNIAAGSTIALQSLGYSFAAGQRYVVIDTAGAANYNEGTLRYVVNGNPQLSGSGANVNNGGHQDLVVTLTAPYVGAMGGTTALVAGTPVSSPPNWGYDGTNLSVTGTSFATITGSMGTLTNSGTLTGAFALSTSTAANIAAIENDGVIAATSSGSSGLYNGGTIGTLVNRGAVTTAAYGGVSNGGTLIRFENTGNVTGSQQGLNNSGTLTSAFNSGTITAAGAYGVLNSSQFGALTNTGLISGFYGVISSKTGVANAQMGTLTNSGTITGTNRGVVNSGGYIGTLDNQAGGQILATGGVSADVQAVGNFSGTIGVVRNAGTISGSYYGIYNASSIGTIDNLAGGVITGLGGAISNQESTASIGQIRNAGTIAGWIINRSQNDLRISGATDGTFGTLTGFGPTYSSTIVSTNADVHFNGGNLLLNDHFDLAGTRTAYNDSSVLQVNNALRVSGNFSQGVDGTLQIGVASGALTTGNFGTDAGYGRLLVSGNSYIAPGSTIALQSLGYTFAAGQRYVVIDTAGSATYNEGSLRYLVNGYPALAASGAKVGNGSNVDLVVTIFSPSSLGTIGGTTALVRNTPNATSPDWTFDGANLTISGTTYGSINGSLGSLTNNGTLTGTSALAIGGNGGGIAAIENNGLIHSTGATDSAIYNGGVVGTLLNKNALISENMAGVNTVNVMTRLDNQGQITGGRLGVSNAGVLTSLTNVGTISATSSSGIGLWSAGQIGSINNSGLVKGNSGVMIAASGNPTLPSTVNSLINSGAVVGTFAGLSNYGGTISTIDNLVGGRFTGTDTTYSSGIVNDWTVLNGVAYGGTIGSINNAGTLTGGYYGIYNANSIGTINNLAGGLITGLGGAISNQNSTSSIGQINNAGTIAGWIINRSQNDLRISGATDGTFGTITTFGPTYGGTIVSTNADVRFNGGNLVVGNNFDLAGSRTAYNDASVLQINKAIQVSGNYAQAAGATLQIGVASNAVTTGDSATDSGYGRLVVSGNTTLAFGSSVALQSLGYNFAAGQRFVVIDTAGTAAYNANSLVYSVNGSTTLDASGAEVANGSHKNLVVTLANGTGANNRSGNGGINDGAGSSSASALAGAASGVSGSNAGNSGNGSNNAGLPAFDPRSNATIASTQNASSALTGLLGYTGVSDPKLLNLYNATLGSLSDHSTDSANRVGKQLAPAQNTRAAGAATFDSLGVVNAHVNGLRVARAGGTGIATGDSAAHWGVWGQAFGGHASQSARDGVDGYSANYGGLLVGADRAFGDRVRAGGAFQFSRTVINNDGSSAGNSTSVNGYGLIAYAAYTGEPWYVNLTGSMVLQRYDSNRLVSMQGFNGMANGNFNGQQYVTSAEFGWPLAVGRAIVTPLASVTYSYLNQNSYTETGGNGTALSVGSAGSSSVRSALGAKLAVPFETSAGSLVPELSLRWVHEYNRTRQTTGASFAADPSGQTGFTTVGATPVSDLAEVSLGLTLMRANNLSASIRYDLQAGSGFISHTGIVRVQQRF